MIRFFLAIILFSNTFAGTGMTSLHMCSAYKASAKEVMHGQTEEFLFHMKKCIDSAECMGDFELLKSKFLETCQNTRKIISNAEIYLKRKEHRAVFLSIGRISESKCFIPNDLVNKIFEFKYGNKYFLEVASKQPSSRYLDEELLGNLPHSDWQTIHETQNTPLLLEEISKLDGVRKYFQSPLLLEIFLKFKLLNSETYCFMPDLKAIEDIIGRKGTNLYLSFSKLNELPQTIWLMDFITTLDISHNEIKLLPHAICKLKNLENLNASHNPLNEIPNELIELNNLTELNLSHTNLFKPSMLTDMQFSIKKLAFYGIPAAGLGGGLGFTALMLPHSIVLGVAALLAVQPPILECLHHHKHGLHGLYHGIMQ